MAVDIKLKLIVKVENVFYLAYLLLLLKSKTFNVDTLLGGSAVSPSGQQA